MCIVLNTYLIGKVRIEYVSYWLLTVSSLPYVKHSNWQRLKICLGNFHIVMSFLKYSLYKQSNTIFLDIKNLNVFLHDRAYVFVY